jgi:hypothetical protein
MKEISWDLVSNKPDQCAEFAAVHEFFAWRKHHASRFGLLKKSKKKCADDSLSRAFESREDSIPALFSPEGNRVLKDHPEYGRPVFAVVWYADEEWAILCTADEATLINSSLISSYRRQKEGAQKRRREIQELWDLSPISLRKPLNSVASFISSNHQ